MTSPRFTALPWSVLGGQPSEWPNRALHLRLSQRALVRDHIWGRDYAALFVKVDRLRGINAAFGHQAGDQVLRSVGATLAAVLGSSELVGRYSGGEFAVFLTDISDVAATERVAGTLTAALRRVVALEGGLEVQVSASVGLAFGPATCAESLISAAEAAACRAKELGRGRLHVLGDGLRERLADSRELGPELARAVAADQLEVYYQPIVELSTGKIVSLEALVRWSHPVRGLMGPDTFLPVAEELDLLGTIDEWVLREACRAACSWVEQSPEPVSVSVNVGSVRLASPGFVAQVCRALTEAGLAPSSLVLEVTESAVIARVAEAGKALEELRELGVGIAMDDFGTGYSSMLRLRRLPFDKLKIDREFVAGLPGSSEDVAICAGAITLADRLDLSLIAEGIETDEQAQALADLGCRFGQGFWWSPPVEACAAALLIASAAKHPSGWCVDHSRRTEDPASGDARCSAASDA